MCGGTGDIAFKLIHKARKDAPGPLSVNVTVADINPTMLEYCKKRSTELGILQNLKFIEANAEKLEAIKSDQFDLYTIGFGFRNITDKDASLKEAYRVLRKGGRFMCLEVSQV